ncbi:unnamed protein product, partial [marine sediment metagenome]
KPSINRGVLGAQVSLNPSFSAYKIPYEGETRNKSNDHSLKDPA